MTSASFALTPLSIEETANLRSLGGEIYVADSQPGYPCRQCLRDAEIRDELLLVSYDPFSLSSPYRSASPIFLHRNDCGNPDPTGEMPSQLTVRQLSVRAFDPDEMMIEAKVIDGTELPATIEAMFADARARMLHVHNAHRGCYAVRVDRA